MHNGDVPVKYSRHNVRRLWRTNDEAGAMQWVLVDIVISAVVLLAVNLLERRQKQGGKRT